MNDSHSIDRDAEMAASFSSTGDVKLKTSTVLMVYQQQPLDLLNKHLAEKEKIPPQPFLLCGGRRKASGYISIDYLSCRFYRFFRVLITDDQPQNRC